MGSARPDILGWTHETLRCIHRQSPSFALVRRTLTQLYMCDATSRPWELYNCSKMIPLAKGARPSVRPIAVPTAWHKVASSLITKLLLPEFKTATAGTQHGIGLKNGAGVLVERVRTLMKECPTQAIAQIDISNAFGCIDREAASRVLARHTHNAARVLNKWLTSTQWATCQRSTTEYVVLPTREGIPQGDPASAALFTVTLQTAIDAAMQLHDSMISQLWRRRSGCLRYLMSHEGITLVGQPIDPEKPEWHPSIPFDSQSYTDQWLSKRRSKQRQAMRKLVQLLDKAPPEMNMMHHIWFLMQLGWNTSDVHLWRGVPFDRLQAHLCQQRDDILSQLAEVFPQLFASERSKHLVFLDARLGGMGIAFPPVRAALLQIGMDLQRRQSNEEPDEPWGTAIEAAWQILEAVQTAPEEVLHVSRSDLMIKGYRTQDLCSATCGRAIRALANQRCAVADSSCSPVSTSTIPRRCNLSPCASAPCRTLWERS